MSDSRPNILYIMSDDHTVNAISCYNGWLNEVVDTPNIDRIANEGMRFDNCICNNALCSPSRASIITGQYSHKNGVLRLNQPLRDDHPNFVRQLQASGYQTGIAGKWHLGSEPDGFDYWEVLPGQGAYFDPSFTRNGEPTQYEGYATDIITDLSLNWLKARDPDKPFLMLCHHKAPHGLWEYAPRHADLFTDGDLPEPSNLYKPFDKVSSALEDHHRTILMQAERMDEGLRGREWPTGRLDTTGMSTTEKIHAAYQKYVKDYLRCIVAIDEGVGRLLDYLDEEGLTENTIVVYTSDQGMFLGEHSYFDKRLILEESLLMPYVMRYPGAIAPGSVNEDIVVNVDFGATYLDFAGLQPDAQVQGRSFRALCEGKTPEDWRQSAFYAYWDGPTKHYGVRTQNYTLAVHRTGERDLFDLEKDPWEMTSVYGDPAYADVQAEVEADLARLIEEIDICAEELPQE